MAWYTGITNFVAQDLPTMMDASYAGIKLGDIVNGALVGGLSTKLAGGDVLKGAAFGAVGGAVANQDESIFGSYANELGGAVTGYGVADASDLNGLLGAGAGALTARLGEAYGEGDEVVKAAEGGTNGADKGAGGDSGDMDMSGAGVSGDKGVGGWLSQYGLQTEDGDGTLLGKALVGGVAQYAASKEAEESEERQAKIIEHAARNKAELDEEFDQRNLGAFTAKNIPMIVRNQ